MTPDATAKRVWQWFRCRVGLHNWRSGGFTIYWCPDCGKRK